MCVDRLSRVVWRLAEKLLVLEEQVQESGLIEPRQERAIVAAYGALSHDQIALEPRGFKVPVAENDVKAPVGEDLRHVHECHRAAHPALEGIESNYHRRG